MSTSPFPSFRSTDSTLGHSSKPITESRADTKHTMMMISGGAFDVTELPVDILCEIFEKATDLPSANHVSRLITSPSRLDPTALGQVCSRWRNVAIHLPKLWSNIRICNPRPSLVHLTNVWLKRSGNTPLDLEIDYDVKPNRDYDIESAAQILASLISRLEFWQRFRCEMPIDVLEPLHAVIRSPYKPLILESVSFRFYASSPRYFHHLKQFIDAIWEYFHGCPTLRQVCWTDYDVGSLPKHAPFQQLTHIHVVSPATVDDTLSFLAQVPFIQCLVVEDLSPLSPTASPQILLQHLQVLSVTARNDGAGPLFAHLTCPSLKSLELTYRTYRYPSQNFSEIPSLLERSRCHLQKLNLIERGQPDGDLEEFLSNSPLQSLTSLNIWMESVPEEIIALLMSQSPAGSHHCAPSLEELSLDKCGATSDGTLARLVSSRWHKALDSNYSTPLGQLRRAVIIPRVWFGPIDEAFFSKHVLS